MPATAKVSKIVVYKSQRKMHLYDSTGTLLKTYRISLGDQPVGQKQFEGDERTPEGAYTINDKNPHSSYYKNLGISYPTQQQREQAKQQGRSPGRDIKIHGLPNGRKTAGKFHSLTDWTNGCIAITNEEMEDIYQHTRVGTPIIIYP
jgi:murein L,D-transpeptidase YafK